MTDDTFLFSLEEQTHVQGPVRVSSEHPTTDPSWTPLLKLIQAQVACRPDMLAVVSENGQLTYEAFDRRANQLAQHLLQRGAGPEIHIGICLERSCEMLVSLYAVLKTGAVYVPLDPSYPTERILYMLEDARIAILITTSNLKPELVRSGVYQLYLEYLEREPASAEQPETTLSSLSGPDALAYVIYTSGSTGKPKGVQVTQRGLHNLVSWHLQAFGLTPRDRTGQIASWSFDAAGWELWPSLAVGATVCIVPEEVRVQPSLLLDWLVAEQITVSFVPTPLVQELLAAPWPAWTALRLLLTGGDRLRHRPECAFPVPLINNYGPTEYSVVATSGRVDPAAELNSLPSIGRPIAGTQVYILDRQLHPVPAGMEGELYLGGKGLARGYLHRPALTAERFVPDPFGEQSGGRLYRTGDLVRADPEGNLHFLGRVDEQVKIRGIRVELGEIEAALHQLPMVREAVVLLRKSSAAEPRLVAYLVVQGEAAPPLNQVRQHLQAHLPDYMLPSAIVRLEHLPLTPNGKVDREALPDPEDAQTHLEESYIAPRNAVEVRLAEIWADLLGIAHVGIQDNFFSLGGHSLLATRAIARVRERLHVELTLRTLFDFPTIEQLAVHIERLSSRSTLRAPAAIRMTEWQQDLPLSFAQQRLWFLDQLEPGNPFYNATMAIQFDGNLRISALERCFNEIVQRHAVLRSAFTTVGGKPLQIVSPPLALPLPLIDLNGLPSAEARQRAFGQLAVEEGRRPFDLSKSPLLRISLLRQGAKRHLLLLSMHHIVSDDWSMEVLLREVSALYEAFVADKPSPLPALPIQYVDYALWQREWLQEERLAQQLSYWRRQLVDLPLLQLPTDRPHPVVQSYHGSTFSFAVPPEITQKLRDVSQQTDTTLFMALLAAFNVLLYRYSGQDDLVIGSPIANRMRGETRDLIGFFVNTLVLRTRLARTTTFRELLGQVRQTALEAYAHQDIPFEKLVEELQPERNLMRQPLFQAAFALLNDPLLVVTVADVTLRLQDVDNGTAKFDLTLFMNDEREQLTGILEYNTDIFDRTTIASMAEHFCTLLQGIVNHPASPVADLPLLQTTEREYIVHTWNATAVPYPAQRCVHELFEEQVLHSPDMVAVSYDETQLTYEALNGYANQLAHLLQRSQVGPEVPVGICLERSPELIIGLLGILKAGGVYVPLDLAYPKERLAFLLQDAQIAIVLTQQKLRDALPALTTQTVYLDADWDQVACESRANLGSGTTAENLAYVIYTSGSTGLPKGVAVPHKAINRLVCNADFVQLGTTDRVAQASNTSFDAATFEIWGALLNGGRLTGIAKETALDPQTFAEVLRQHQITTLFVTTALFNQSVKERADIFQPLRHLLFGGEAVDPWWVREALTQGAPERLLHVYGPTENTTFSSWYLVREVPEGAVTVPIGRPIANTQFYVLDQRFQPVPVGVRGELYIGGEGLARDYRGHPALTARSYVPHPFSTRPGARLYKTGDLVRQLANGCIEFLGRVDHQVKIRGFRVELGEIEANLNQHPAVEDAVVAVREDIPGDKRLIAYVVPSPVEAEAEEEEDLPGEHITTWQELFDETYRSSAQEDSGDFNIVGWNSSYTGQALPYEHMQEWREHTLERLLAVEPHRVLEIGCGTGLLLLRLAPGSSKYWGTDFSAEVLQLLQRQVQERELSQVQLLQRMADDFSGLEEQTFDTIVLNSIVQYFPGMQYLLRVLEGSLQKVVPGGTIFLGDIRNQQLLEIFHTSIELYKSDDASPLDQFRQRVQTNMVQESELLLDPAFFYALQQRYPQISQVCIRPKRGRYDNELTMFRYDVQLKIGLPSSPAPATLRWQDWAEQGLSPSGLRQWLLEQQPTSLALTRIPNARLVRELAALKLLATSGTELATVGDLRLALASCAQSTGSTPEGLYVLGQQLGYEVDVRWSGDAGDGSFDAIFYLPAALEEAQSLNWPQPSRTRPWTEYANQPLREGLRSGSHLVPELRSYLQARLSEYMIPSSFVFLETLPLNANGKVDRHALPAPTQFRPLQNVAYLAPRDPIEDILADIWVDVLGIEQIGVQDNFFEIGGHSLLATQVTSRMSDTFHIPVPLRTIFEAPTVEGLARTLSQSEKQPGQMIAIARAQKKLNSMSIEKIREALQSKKQTRGA